jgi:hypothetical protein
MASSVDNFSWLSLHILILPLVEAGFKKFSISKSLQFPCFLSNRDDANFTLAIITKCLDVSQN